MRIGDWSSDVCSSDLAEAAGLKLAPPYRADRVAEREAADDVRAAGDRREMEVLLDGVVDVVEGLRHQRRPGRRQGPDGGEVVGVYRSVAVLRQRVDFLGRGAEQLHAFLFGIVEPLVAVCLERRTVVFPHP